MDIVNVVNGRARYSLHEPKNVVSCLNDTPRITGAFGTAFVTFTPNVVPISGRPTASI